MKTVLYWITALVVGFSIIVQSVAISTHAGAVVRTQFDAQFITLAPYAAFVAMLLLFISWHTSGRNEYTDKQVAAKIAEAEKVQTAYWADLAFDVAVDHQDEIKRLKDSCEAALIKADKPNDMNRLRAVEGSLQEYRFYVEGVIDECRQDHRKRSHHIAKSKALHHRIVNASNAIDDLVGK